MGRDGSRPASPAVLAVDGGGSKADAILVDRAGRIVGSGRWLGRSSVGPTDSLDGLSSAVEAACVDAGLDPARRPLAAVGAFCLAGVDFPADERRADRALARRGWTGRNLVHNDTFAVLRAGTDRGWGVAVVCGAGMNAIGVGPDGQTARFAALGPLSGDLAAGGEWVGLAALGAAIRARDGRGPRTALEQAVAAHFGGSRPETVMRAMYRGSLPPDRLTELPPAVFDAASRGDVVAREILDRLADEIVTWATAAIRRLRATRADVDVVLGGGIFRAGDPMFLDRIDVGITPVAPHAHIRILTGPPVLGAALMGLDEIGATPAASRRIRRALEETNDRAAIAAGNPTRGA